MIYWLVAFLSLPLSLASHEVGLPGWVRPGYAVTLDLHWDAQGLKGMADLEAEDAAALGPGAQAKLLSAFRINGEAPKSIRAEAPKEGSQRWSLLWPGMAQPKVMDIECSLFQGGKAPGWCRVFVFFGGEDPERSFFFRTHEGLHWPQVAGPSPGELEMLRWPNLIRQGFRHIVPEGLDHILFVLGLCLGASSLLSLLGLVTAFTLAHSITLGLASAGIFELSPRLVEPLIAVSIAIIALETLAKPKPPRWRWALVFAFGLLHGLGFAGALRDLGMPQGSWARTLLGFNIGVELGQLTVVAAFLALFWWARKHGWYRWLVQIPASALIALAGLYWCFERIFKA